MHPQGGVWDILFGCLLGYLWRINREPQKKTWRKLIFLTFFVKNRQKLQKLGKNSILHRKVCDTWKYTNFGVLNSFLMLILWFEVFWRSYPHHFCEKRPDFDEFQSYPKSKCDTCICTIFGVLILFLNPILWFKVIWRSNPHHFSEELIGQIWLQ